MPLLRPRTSFDYHAVIMRNRLLAGSIILNIVLLAAFAVAMAAPVEQRGVTVWFSPDGGCAETVVDAIRNSTRSIDVAIYHLTHPDIAKAIADAHRRRVTVRVVMDDSQSQATYSGATYLHNRDVDVRIWKPAMMHHKFVIIDKKYVITGSFNYTKSADTSNAENLVRIADRPEIVEAYAAEFRKLMDASSAYRPKRD